jgi:type II secretory pathway pseudopilin PulG
MPKIFKQKKLKGFSLFEVIITIGVILITSSLVFPFSIQKIQESKLENYASQLVTDIYFQQQESFYKNLPKGIALNDNGYTLFDGETLAGATETSYNDYPNGININSIIFSGGSEFYFPQGEFRPSSSGEATFSDGYNQIKVFINREGLIFYEIP